MRTRFVVGVLATVLTADAAVVAARSGGEPARPAPAAAPAAPAGTGAGAAPAPKATTPPKPKPKPPPRVVFSATTGNGTPRVLSAGVTGAGARAERLPAVPSHAVSRAAGLTVASEVLDSNEHTGCGFAGCTTTRFTEAGIVVRSLAGGSRTVLTKGGYDTEPSFSPDGSAIAYLAHARRKDGTETDIVRVIAPTGESLRTYVAPGGGRYATPVWSPDGEHIAVAEWPDSADAKGSVVLLPFGAGSPRKVGSGRFDQLRWAPNGRFLIARGVVLGPHEGYSTQATTGYDLWVVAVSGVPARRLTRFAPAVRRDRQGEFCGQVVYELGAMDPIVSPDSTMVAYATNAPHRARAGRGWDVEVMNVDGTGRRTAWKAPAARCVKGQISENAGRPLGWA